jgi:thioredoxin-dependent peroxiredoxin
MKLEGWIGLALLTLAAASGPWAQKGPRGDATMEATRVTEGTEAPNFTADSTEGKRISLSDYRGKVVVLYFYPKDDTPGCTKEACSFRDAESQLQRLGVQVLGVSMDDIESHEKFKKKYVLNFPLISDPEGKIITSYGVWKESSLFGKTALGLSRSTFLIDSSGIVRKIWKGVKVEGHDQEVIDYIKKNLMNG